MKYVLSLILTVSGFTFIHAQSITFVNKSVCNPEFAEQGNITNYYVQGAGHNVYLSYPVEAQIGSFSDQQYEVGTEENPLVIYESPNAPATQRDVEIAVTEEGDNAYVEFEEEIDVDKAKNFVNSGVWEFREEPNYNRFQAKNYEEIENQVWTCVIKERDDDM